MSLSYSSLEPMPCPARPDELPHLVRLRPDDLVDAVEPPARYEVSTELDGASGHPEEEERGRSGERGDREEAHLFL
jgi:hypothetical protein